MCVILLSISAVSANNNITDEMRTIDNANDNIGVNNLNNLDSLKNIFNDGSDENQVEITSDEYYEASKRVNPIALKALINSYEEQYVDNTWNVKKVYPSYITLDNDYNSFTTQFTNGHYYIKPYGCSISGRNATFTLDGAGHTIYMGGFKNTIGVGAYDNTKITIKNVNFVDGRIHIGGNVDFILFKNCTFTSKYDTALLHVTTSNVRVESCTFYSSIINSTKGSVIWEGEKGCLYGCTFNKCVGSNGGAVTWYGNSGIIRSCTFKDCSATNGGAIYIKGKSAQISYGTFSNNHAANGGAIYIAGNDAYLLKNDIKYNNATNGGGLYIAGNNCKLTQTTQNTQGTFQNNGAANGGAIYLSGSNCSISGQKFISNKAVKGKTLYVYYGSSNLDESDDVYYFVPIPTKLIVSSITTNYNSDKYLIATLKDNDENIICGAKITIKLSNGNTQDLLTDDKGQVEFSTNGLSPDNYDATIIFDGNKDYLSSLNTAKIVVQKIATHLIAQPVETEYNSGENLVVFLKDSKGKSLTHIKIVIKINNTSNVLTTDNEGKVILPVNNLIPDSYNALISFEGNNFYLASSTSTTILVNKIKTNLIPVNIDTVFNGGKYFVVNLKDNYGNPISGLQVIIKLPDGQIATPISDKDGKIKYSTMGLYPKTHIPIITFVGNNIYDSSSAIGKIVVKKATLKITAKAKTFKKSVKTKKYSITLKNNLNKVMKNTKVTIKVNKKTYTAKTNSKGVATFKITKLTKKGSFNSVITYKGNKYYNKITKKVKINVK